MTDSWSLGLGEGRFNCCTSSSSVLHEGVGQCGSATLLRVKKGTGSGGALLTLVRGWEFDVTLRDRERLVRVLGNFFVNVYLPTRVYEF